MTFHLAKSTIFHSDKRISPDPVGVQNELIEGLRADPILGSMPAAPWNAVAVSG
jgi:hypothetical protein